MQGSQAVDRWVVVPRRSPSALVRLFCFPYGGAGASAYRTWHQGLPSTVEVCAIQLPGREARVGEAPLADLDQVVMSLVDALEPLSDIPFVFFGHSLGAFLAFELARELRDEQRPGPAHLIVSGQRAPHRPNALPPCFHLPDAEFVEELQRRYDAIPAVVRDNPQIMQLLLPTLRADFTMHDTYEYVAGSPLTCPIASFGGDRDSEVAAHELAEWQACTSGAFTSRVFTGGHFYIRTAQDALLQAIAELLTPLQARPAVGLA